MQSKFELLHCEGDCKTTYRTRCAQIIYVQNSPRRRRSFNHHATCGRDQRWKGFYSSQKCHCCRHPFQIREHNSLAIL
ncbi:hypothetical protein AB6A40_009556 [Gnathostoma spinigerum]|uniref:Uncharacterized protein n=1 Tax=Gnathostoma spinigerum TaxID=75299 RepID=A0ABD6F0W0_9BILA